VPGQGVRPPREGDGSDGRGKAHEAMEERRWQAHPVEGGRGHAVCRRRGGIPANWAGGGRERTGYADQTKLSVAGRRDDIVFFLGVRWGGGREGRRGGMYRHPSVVVTRALGPTE